MARILLVDDESFVRDLVQIYLKGTDHTVVEASDGSEAIELFRQEPADLVITDNAMPRMTGLEMVALIREIAPNTKIIAMSGVGMGKREREAVDEVLTKPFTREDFMAAVRRQLG